MPPQPQLHLQRLGIGGGSNMASHGCTTELGLALGRCAELLACARSDVATATAFASELRQTWCLVAELGPLLNELSAANLHASAELECAEAVQVCCWFVGLGAGRLLPTVEPQHPCRSPRNSGSSRRKVRLPPPLPPMLPRQSSPRWSRTLAWPGAARGRGRFRRC